MSKTHRTASEALAMCDYARARRVEPKVPLVRMTPEQQSSFFWRTKVLRQKDERAQQ